MNDYLSIFRNGACFFIILIIGVDGPNVTVSSENVFYCVYGGKDGMVHVVVFEQAITTAGM